VPNPDQIVIATKKTQDIILMDFKETENAATDFWEAWRRRPSTDFLGE
jgi:hypothetical protein